MKYFKVEEEYMQGLPQRIEVCADGQPCGNDYQTGAIEHVILGYNVFEEDEQGMTQNVEFYAVATDFRTFENNAHEVLKQIKADYPADEWQNNNW